MASILEMGCLCPGMEKWFLGRENTRPVLSVAGDKGRLLQVASTTVKLPGNDVGEMFQLRGDFENSGEP